MDDTLKAYLPDLNLIQTLNKKWDECTDAELITKIREEYKHLQYNANRQQALQARLSQLENHIYSTKWI
jgi:hypothetical protein